MNCLNRVILVFAGLFPLVFLGAPAEGRVNLTQRKQVTTLPGNLVSSIRATLEPSAARPVGFPAPIQTELLQALPQNFRIACTSMIESWGEIARGTDEWRVRVLVRQADQVWLSFQCASSSPEYQKDYDERLAMLRLATGKLEFVPLGMEAENDSTLYHLEFSELVTLEGVQAIALKVAEPAGNPCCDGPESRSGETWRIFADSPLGVVELLSLTTARDDSSHSDDPEVDTETTYRAQITLNRDAQNQVTAVSDTFREEVKDITYEGDKANAHTVSQHSGTLRYRWISPSMHFEEIK
jgi:hypothetical protein